jgi:carbon-monoxide dehydrogenase medium subunit
VILRPFEYVECASVAQAVAAMREHGDRARLIAGGTALVPLMKHQILRPEVLVSLAGIPALAAIERLGACPTIEERPRSAGVLPSAGLPISMDGGLSLGALATHQEVARSPLVRAVSPLLAYACGRVASPAIRSMGTLGGNLCYGESASDPSPALLALRGRVRLSGPGGARAVPLPEFFTGFYETALGEGEILCAVEVPPLPAGARWRYLKWTPRAQEDKALVGLAAVLVMEDGRCRLARLGLGGVAASPVVLAAAEQALEGQRLDAATVQRAADVAAREVEPMDDLQGSAEYRRDMVRVWVRRIVGELAREGER